MADPPPGGEQWNIQNLQYRQILADAAQRYNIPVQALLNIGRLESDWNPQKYTSSTQAAGMFQLTPQLLSHMQTLWGYRPDPYNVAQAADAAARALYEFGTGTGVGKVSYNFETNDPTGGGVYYPPHPFNLEQAIGAFNGGATGYMRMLGGDPNNPEGKWNANYVVQGTQGLLGWEQLSEPARNRYEFFWPDKPRPIQQPYGIGSDIHFEPWATQEQLEGAILYAPEMLGWADQAALDPTQISPAFKQDVTGWYLDPNMLLNNPGMLTAKEGAYLQDIGVLSPDMGYLKEWDTWAPTSHMAQYPGWHMVSTANPDVVESGFFDQWLPSGFKAAGPEVWQQTPLEFWVPDASLQNLFGSESTGAQAGGAGFDVFNPQGGINYDLLNAPGAISPTLGAMLQSQGQFPHLGYNPVDQVWQDTSPGGGDWFRVNTANVDPAYQAQIMQQFATNWPTQFAAGQFDDLFEGTGTDPWSGPPVLNWLPPPARGAAYDYVPYDDAAVGAGLGYQGSYGITTFDPGTVALGNAINRTAQQIIAQGYAQGGNPSGVPGWTYTPQGTLVSTNPINVQQNPDPYGPGTPFTSPGVVRTGLEPFGV